MADQRYLVVNWHFRAWLRRQHFSGWTRPRWACVSRCFYASFGWGSVTWYPRGIPASLTHASEPLRD